MAERGPFNVVFHGIQPDWIEEEMADDIDFKKDVLEQRIRTIIRDQVVLHYLHGIQNGLGEISKSYLLVWILDFFT